MTRPAGRRRRVAPVAELYPPQGEWTEEDYFALPDRNRYVELSDGELVMPPHPTFRHQEALKRLFLRLHAFVEARGLGVVMLAPLPVRLWPGKIREPDIFFVFRQHADRIGEQVCGIPDLIVEVTCRRRPGWTGWRSSRNTPGQACGSTGWWTRTPGRWGCTGWRAAPTCCGAGGVRGKWRLRDSFWGLKFGLR